MVWECWGKNYRSELIEERLENRWIIECFGDETIGLDEDGEELDIVLEAHKVMREGAYLKLYIDKHQSVTSYDEVTWEELPKAVQEKWRDY